MPPRDYDRGPPPPAMDYRGGRPDMRGPPPDRFADRGPPRDRERDFERPRDRDRERDRGDRDRDYGGRDRYEREKRPREASPGR